MAFSQKKTFEFAGTVTSAKGLLKRRVIGKPVSGILTITGQKDDFDSPINRVFRLGGKVTEAPLVGSLFPGKDLSREDYPYVLKNLQVSDEMQSDSGKVEITLTVVPWTKLDAIRAIGTAKSWLYKYMVDAVQVVGGATLVSVEDVPDPERKR